MSENQYKKNRKVYKKEIMLNREEKHISFKRKVNYKSCKRRKS